MILRILKGCKGGARKEIENNFIDVFKNDGARLTRLIQKQFDSFSDKSMRFDVFFIPFPSVQEFRNKFNEALK